jgi:uncharacterized protein (UPF0248 family)
MKITQIDTSSRNAKIILENGEQLEGIVKVVTTSSLDDISRVTLTALVYNEPKKVHHRYVNIKTNNEVLLTEAEVVRFFDNRDPRDWKKYV